MRIFRLLGKLLRSFFEDPADVDPSVRVAKAYRPHPDGSRQYFTYRVE
jgi:hypothetical protein